MTAAQDLIASYRSLTTLPDAVTKLLQLINDGRTTMKDFDKVIILGPILVSSLLHLVNRSLSASQFSESIGRAVATYQEQVITALT